MLLVQGACFATFGVFVVLGKRKAATAGMKSEPLRPKKAKIAKVLKHVRAERA